MTVTSRTKYFRVCLTRPLFTLISTLAVCSAPSHVNRGGFTPRDLSLPYKVDAKPFRDCQKRTSPPVKSYWIFTNLTLTNDYKNAIRPHGWVTPNTKLPNDTHTTWAMGHEPWAMRTTVDSFGRDSMLMRVGLYNGVIRWGRNHKAQIWIFFVMIG